LSDHFFARSPMPGFIEVDIWEKQARRDDCGPGFAMIAVPHVAAVLNVWNDADREIWDHCTIILAAGLRIETTACFEQIEEAIINATKQKEIAA